MTGVSGPRPILGPASPRTLHARGADRSTPLQRGRRSIASSCVTSSCLARKSLIAAFTAVTVKAGAAREFDQVLLKVAPMFSLVLIPSEARGQHVERDLVGVPRHEPQCADRRTHSLRVIQQSPGACQHVGAVPLSQERGQIAVAAQRLPQFVPLRAAALNINRSCHASRTSPPRA